MARLLPPIKYPAEVMMSDDGMTLCAFFPADRNGIRRAHRYDWNETEGEFQMGAIATYRRSPAIPNQWERVTIEELSWSRFDA